MSSHAELAEHVSNLGRSLATSAEGIEAGELSLSEMEAHVRGWENELADITDLVRALRG